MMSLLVVTGIPPGRTPFLSTYCEICNFERKLYDVHKGVKSFSGCLRGANCINIGLKKKTLRLHRGIKEY